MGNGSVIGTCPHCGGDVLHGRYGFYCAKKCGMYLAKVYRHTLTEVQLKMLLSGKPTVFVQNGRKTVVLPEIEEHSYADRKCYQWKTER